LSLNVIDTSQSLTKTWSHAVTNGNSDAMQFIINILINKQQILKLCILRPDSQCTCNLTLCSHNLCCHGRAVGIKNCVLYSCLSYLAGKSYLFSVILYCHLWPFCLYHVSTQYLINSMNFGKTSLNINFDSLYIFCLKHFSFKEQFREILS
jgi:hypothetical protein